MTWSRPVPCVEPWANKMIRFRLSDSFLELAPLAREWDAFVERNGSDIFMTFDWCRTWWKYYGKDRRLSIYVFFADDEIVGLFPMFIEKISIGIASIKVAKLVGSDFTIIQFTPAIRREFSGCILEALCDSLRDEKCDIVHLGPISGIMGMPDISINRSIFRTRKRIVFGQTFFDLASNREDQFKKITDTDRKDIRRSYARLAKIAGDPEPGIHRVFADEGNFDEMFDDFVRTHQSNWKMKNQGGHFIDWPKSLDFHREVAREEMRMGRLRLLKLSINGICLGFEYDYWFGGMCFEILSGRNMDEMLRGVSIGKINYWEKIKLLIDSNIQVLDSMRGIYEYKRKLGGRNCGIASIFLTRENILSVAKILLFRVVSSCIHILYYKIWFVRMRRYFSAKPQPLKSLWIKLSFLAY